MRALLDVLMLAGRYTLLDHVAGLPVLEAAGRRGVAVVVAGVFNSGVLATTRPVVGARFDYRVADPDTVAKVHRIADVCEAHGVDVPSAAIAFVRRQPAVSSVVVGMRSARDVDDNADRFATAVPDALWARSRIDRADRRAMCVVSPSRHRPLLGGVLRAAFAPWALVTLW